MSNVIQPFYVVQGDYGTTLNFVVVDGQGNPVDLTGATVNLHVQAANDPDSEDIDLGGNPVVVDNPTQGECHYQVAEGDFPDPGKFLAQLVASVASASVVTAPGIVIQVVPSLPQANN